MAISVIIADDHRIFRSGLAAILKAYSDIEVIAEANDGEEAVQLTLSKHPDVLLLDLNMPVKSGYEVLQELAKTMCSTKTIIISMHSNIDAIVKAVTAGATGYIPKEADPEEIIQAIHSVVKNHFYFNERVNSAMLKSLISDTSIKPVFEVEADFNEKEKAILQQMIDGQVNADIANSLHISQRTVENIRWQMMKKIGVNNIVGLVVYAIKHNVVRI